MFTVCVGVVHGGEHAQFRIICSLLWRIIFNTFDVHLPLYLNEKRQAYKHFQHIMYQLLFNDYMFIKITIMNSSRANTHFNACHTLTSELRFFPQHFNISNLEARSKKKMVKVLVTEIIHNNLW